MTIVDEAIRYKSGDKNRGRSSFERNDQVWAVLDKDDHPRLQEAINKAAQHGVRVAFSNPCFEVWAIIHFCDHDAPASRIEVQRRLRELMPGYNPKSAKVLSYDSMREQYEAAVGRAQDMCLRREAENGKMIGPYTDVYILTELIRANGKVKTRKR